MFPTGHTLQEWVDALMWDAGLKWVDETLSEEPGAVVSNSTPCPRSDCSRSTNPGGISQNNTTQILQFTVYN